MHRSSPDFLPDAPAEQPVYLSIYRGSDDKVRFLELNAVTAALLEAIADNVENMNGEELLRALAKTINYPDVDALLQHGAAAMQQMLQLEILIGARRAD